MGVDIRGSAERYFDNNNYRKDDEQALIPSTPVKATTKLTNPLTFSTM